MIETWKIISKNPFYEVSNLGRVRNRRNGKVLKLTTKKSGYQFVHLGAKCRDQAVHRLVTEAFVERIPNGMQVNHRNGIKTDNRASNLEVVTQSQNNRHAFRTGLRTWSGDGKNTSLATPERFYKLLSLQSQGLALREIQRHLPELSLSTISDVLSGKTWKDLWRRHKK